MSYDDTVSRIATLESLTVRSLAPVQQAAPVATPQQGLRFDDFLAQATAGAPAAAAYAPAATPAATAPSLLAAAENEVGVAEDPPGSNDGARIADYRTATAGALPGQPWCAYFVSWAAAQAGTPIGDGGQGIGSVAGIRDWASRTGHLLPTGATPAPGDLILFGNQHVGIVESVAGDGTITTVEGNEGDAVTRRTRAPGEATDFVRVNLNQPAAWPITLP